MKKFLVFCLIVLAFLFGHVYQKVKIVMLAYKIHDRRIELDNLIEQKSDFVYNFYKQANLLAINERLSRQELALNYPKKYVKVTAAQTPGLKQPQGSALNVFAKMLSFTSRVEARP